MKEWKAKNKMIKHVGKHNDKSVVVMFREVPGEDHMALVLYTDTLPTRVHDDLMNCLQSDAGQAAKDFADAAHRFVGTDGRNLLSLIHAEGWMKKVRTQDVIMLPRPNQQGVLLSEVNKIIRDLDVGGEAAQKMAQLDANAGLADPEKKAAGVQAAQQVSENGVLNDDALAQNMLKQAEQMKADAKGLVAEADRILKEAYELNPSLAPKKRGRRKKANTEVSA